MTLLADSSKGEQVSCFPHTPLPSFSQGPKRARFPLFEFSTDYITFKEHLESVPNLEAKALFATIYCAYARVGEIVRSRKRDYSNPPITKQRIEFTDEHLIISVLTSKTHQWRRVPTSRVKESWLHKPILQWLGTCGEDLFPYGVRWAEKSFEKYFGTQHIHLLRHWAVTHALQGHRTKEKIPAQFVARLGGWRNFNTFYQTYSHYIVEDYINLI